MKLMIAMLMMLPTLATAATEIVYNSSSNPYIPARGYVTAKQICLNANKDSFKIFVAQHTVETCDSVKTDYSDSTRPKKVCVGRKMVTVPATTKIVSAFTKKEVCQKWNRNDSAYPRCVSSVMKDTMYSTSYTQYKYEQADWRRERPVSSVNKHIETCK